MSIKQFCVLLLSLYCSACGMMSSEHALGTLFAIPIPLYVDQKTLLQLCDDINHYHIGAVLLDKKGTIDQQITIINTLIKQCSPLPLITQDLEWGLTMKLTDGMRFPRAMTCGAMQDDTLITRLAQEIARQAKLVGVDVIWAPVADVNWNPDNPIIGNRSFGQDPELVAKKAAAYLDGLRQEGVPGCIKHFPGHGDTALDSHLALPTIKHDMKRLNAVELVPFKKLIEEGVPCVMTAHVLMPVLDSLPATLSPAITTHLLKDTLHFDGVIVADALRMQALTDHYDAKKIPLQAFQAGCDLLLCPPSLIDAIETFKHAIDAGEITREELVKRATKIQRLRMQCAVDLKKSIDPATVHEKLFTASAKALKKELYQAAITLVCNHGSLVPITNPEKTALIQYGGEHTNAWLNAMREQYPTMPQYRLPSAATGMDLNELADQLTAYDTLIFGIFDPQSAAYASAGIAPAVTSWMAHLQKTKACITILFCSPYLIKSFAFSDGIIQAYEDDEDAQQAAALVLAGHLKPTGRLPVSAGEFTYGTGITR